MRAGPIGSSSGTPCPPEIRVLEREKTPSSNQLCRPRIPLYPYIRLLFLLYLVLPQTQGARIIYTTYVHPYLEENESQIEDLIATAHDKMKAAGMAYLKRAIELLRTQVLGLEPSPQAQAESNSVPASQRPRGYTQALLDRFQLPQARWPINNAGATGPATGADFYNFLASAVHAATSAATGAAATSPESKQGEAGLSSSAGPGIGAFPSGDMTASGTLVPPGIRENADKVTFLAAQREKLSLVLRALDREAAQLRSSDASTSLDVNMDGLQALASGLSSGDRPATSHSGISVGGLSKSRSEADFEKIEAESGAEDNSAQDSESARPTPAASSGSWLPWGWSASGASAKDEKSKDE